MKTVLLFRRSLFPFLLALGYHAQAQAPIGVGIGTTQPFSRLSLGTGGTAGNDRLSRMANFEDPNGTYFYGTGLARNAASYGLGLWGGTGPSLPWNGTSGQLPHLFIESSGRVGIGTLNPDRLLTLQAPASGDLLSFRSSGGSTLWHWTLHGGGVNLAESGVADGRFYIAPGGNVGLGTLNPQARLHVAGGLRLDGLAGTGTRMLTVDLNGTLGATALPVSTDAQTLSLGTSGTQRTLTITGGNSITLEVADNDNSPTNEAQTLSKVGSIVALSAVSGTGGGSFTDADNQTLSFSGNTLSLTNGGSADLSSLKDNLGNHTATQNLRLSGSWLSNDGGNEGLRVTDAGHVGVGTNSPARPLHVRGNGGVLALEGSDHSYLEFYPQGYPAGRKAYLGTPNGGSSHLHLANEQVNGHIALLPGSGTGRVGVGTEEPFSGLSLGTAGSAGNDAFSRVANYEAADGSYFYGTGLATNGSSYGLGLWGGTGSSQPFDGTAGQLPHLFVQNNGHVGVGTLAPTASLDVAGSMRVRGLAGAGTRVVTADGAGHLGTTTISGESTTATNGLTLNGTAVELGGVLTRNTQLEAGNHTWQLTQEGTVSTTIRVTDPSTMAAPISGSASFTASLPQWRQSFLATQTGTVRNIRARIKAAGHIQLYCTLLDEFGNQLGSVLATPGSSGQWVTVTFPFTVNVTAGSRYSIRLNDPLADGTFRMEWAYNSDNPYLNGSSSVTSTTDFLFSVDMDVVQASSLVLPVLAAVGGRLGVGTATPDPGFRFDVNGGIRCVSLTQTSDARFKRDVRPIGEALAKVQALRGVRYHWRRQEFPQRQFTDDEQLGFLAQELEQVLPQAVQKDAQGYYSVDYQKVVPVLTEAIKELQAKLEAAEQKLQQATADNATLRQQAATDRHRAEASAASVEARLRALEAGPAAQARR